MDSDRVYWSHEAATLIGIATSTLRKYCLALEKCSYEVMKDENDRRAFFDHDILVLRDMKKMVDRGMTLENAAEAVVAKQKRQSGTLPVLAEERYVERSEKTFDGEQISSVVQKAAEQYWGNVQREFNGVRDDMQQLKQQNAELKHQNDELQVQLNELTKSVKEIASAMSNDKDERKKKRFFGLF